MTSAVVFVFTPKASGFPGRACSLFPGHAHLEAMNHAVGSSLGHTFWSTPGSLTQTVSLNILQIWSFLVCP